MPVKSFKVAMVAACPFPANWGTPGAIREMSETLADMGHEIHIVTYPYGEDLSVGRAKLWRPWYWRNGAQLHSGPSYQKLLFDFLMIFELCRVVRRERIDIIHAHNYEGVIIGMIAKLFTRRPLLYNAVNLMSDELPSSGFIRPRFLARAIAGVLDWFVPKFPDHFIAITEDLRRAMIKHGVPDSRISFVPCGVKPEMFDRADPTALRERYGVGDRPVIMYTGITSPFQRIDYLLKAFATVLKEEPSALLTVVSPLEHDPNYPAHKAVADSLGVSPSVIWVEGHTLEELPDYLAMATVTVIPRPEIPGHPIKLLNYMAARKPTVCFAGAAKGVKHMQEVLIVPDHDCEALGQGIVTLLRDPALARKLGANARATLVASFDWRTLCHDVETAYEAMTGGASSSAVLENVA